MQNQNIPSEKTAMKDKVVMITGANSGIGKAASLALAKMGANVVMVTRNKEKGEAAKSEIIRESQNAPSISYLLTCRLSNQCGVSQQNFRRNIPNFTSSSTTLDCSTKDVMLQRTATRILSPLTISRHSS